MPARRVRERANERASERVCEQLCTWRSARLVWGLRWRRSRCLTEPKGNEGEHMCPFKNREARASPPAGGALTNSLHSRNPFDRPASSRSAHPSTPSSTFFFLNIIIEAQVIEVHIYEQYKKLSFPLNNSIPKNYSISKCAFLQSPSESCVQFNKHFSAVFKRIFFEKPLLRSELFANTIENTSMSDLLI